MKYILLPVRCNFWTNTSYRLNSQHDKRNFSIYRHGKDLFTITEYTVREKYENSMR